VSSSMIRHYLSRGYSCEYLLPLSVAAYIARHRLYKKEIKASRAISFLHGTPAGR
jgi:hypothetical protein